MDNLGALFEQANRQSEEVTALYTALKSSSRLSTLLEAEVRCNDRKGCLLLHVFRVPAGHAFFQPRYKVSLSENSERSNEAGRANNTHDGERKWKLQAALLPSTGNLTLNCDHVRDYLLDLGTLETGTPGAPIRRVVSTRVAQ